MTSTETKRCCKCKEIQPLTQFGFLNYGTHWHLDHILPISLFNFEQKSDKLICFHWTNYQPLLSDENKKKSNKLQLHYYFNNIVNIVRFNTHKKQQDGYQVVRESVQWLRKRTQVW